MDSLDARHAFRLVILVALLLYGLVGGMVLLMRFQAGFMGMAHARLTGTIVSDVDPATSFSTEPEIATGSPAHGSCSPSSSLPWPHCLCSCT